MPWLLHNLLVAPGATHLDDAAFKNHLLRGRYLSLRTILVCLQYILDHREILPKKSRPSITVYCSKKLLVHHLRLSCSKDSDGVA